MRRLYLSVVLLVINLVSYAQIKDIGGFDYTFINNENSAADFNRTRLWLNFPIKLNKQNHLLVSGFRYSRIQLDFNSDFNFDVRPLKTIHSLEYTLGYTFLLKNEEWRFTAQISPILSSNLRGEIRFDDLLWSGGVLFIRSREEPKKSRLTLGLVYSQRLGIPAPIPFATYFRQVNKNLNYTIGIPISKMKYFLNEKTSLEGFITFDGYYANLTDPIVVGDATANHISMSAIITGLGFDKYLGKRFNLYVKGGYTLRNALRLVENRNDEVFDFDMSKSFTFRGGFKFNF